MASAVVCRDLRGMRDGAWYDAEYDRPIHKPAECSHTQAPHHAVSDVGLIGGGHIPMWGDVSLAHHGVLFFDARPKAKRQGLEVLRLPLENSITEKYSPVRSRLSRSSGFRGAGAGGHDSACADAKGLPSISPLSTMTGSWEGPAPRLHLTRSPPAEEI